MKTILLICAFLLIPVIIKAQNIPIIADHSCVEKFESIPDSILNVTIPLKLLFRHASVGVTINEGLNCIQGTRSNPKECTQYPKDKYNRVNWEFQPRGNSGWFGKVDDFVNEVKNQIDKFDIFSFKYCYLDGLDGIAEPCGAPFSSKNIQKAWEYLRDNMDLLEIAYPNKIFVWWTIPLTQSGQHCTDTLNFLIREYVKSKGKILFDIADIESYDTAGNHLLSSNGWETAFSGYCGEKPPGPSCHPNWTGKLILGKAFWWMMSKIAEVSEITDIKLPESDSPEFQISPNPVTESMLVRFKLSNTNKVSISLFNTFGNEIAVIFDGTREAGVNSEQFSLCDYHLSDGVYFCHLQLGGESKMIKIVKIE